MDIYQGRIECPAEEVGYDSKRLEAITIFFKRMIEKNIIFGVSYRLARRGKVFAAAALGSRHYNKPDFPMLPETPFRLASQTKLFTAVAVQMLVEDGLITIDETVANYLPQFDGEPYNAITIFHLLTHTSGLYSEGSIPDKHHMNAYEHIDLQNEKDGVNTDWLAAGLRAGLRRKPGTEFQYSSFGIMVLGAVLEKVTGIKLTDFIIERICKPLEMKSTTFNPTPEMAENAVVFDEWHENQLQDIVNGNKKEHGIWDAIPPGASGLFSTTEDMIRFASMVQQNGRLGETRILGRKAVEVMTTQQLQDIPDYGWGGNVKDRKYGIGVDMRRSPFALYSPGVFHHEGAGHSIYIIDRAEEMVCSCVYPWVNGTWNAECNERLYNVMWSGLM